MHDGASVVNERRHVTVFSLLYQPRKQLADGWFPQHCSYKAQEFPVTSSPQQKKLCFRSCLFICMCVGGGGCLWYFLGIEPLSFGSTRRSNSGPSMSTDHGVGGGDTRSAECPFSFALSLGFDLKI